MVADSARFARTETVKALPPPRAVHGPFAWMRANLFASPSNTVLTLLTLACLAAIIPSLVQFFVVDAVWTGAGREACRAETAGRTVGACWAFVANRLGYFIYGAYPQALRWRVDTFFALLAFALAWLLWLDAPRRGLGALFAFVVLPVVSYLLLAGAPRLGLAAVPTSLWGGVLVTVVVSAVGIAVSLPFGILLALGRRSKLPVVRLFSIAYIEVLRGVPLITVLFMANTMLPLFLPETLSVDRLARPLVGVALFASAYMAEVVRGGLQAIPKGQVEGALSLGLGYWQAMGLVVLPQALTVVIPGIVNTFIGLFKDTTLVAVVGIFDFLRTVEASRADPAWAAPSVGVTGYAFAGLFYFACCWGMSRYAAAVERRLAAGGRR